MCFRAAAARARLLLQAQGLWIEQIIIIILADHC